MACFPAIPQLMLDTAALKLVPFVWRTGARKSQTSYMCLSVSPQKTERQQVCGGLWIAGLEGGKDACDLIHEVMIYTSSFATVGQAGCLPHGGRATCREGTRRLPCGARQTFDTASRDPRRER